MEKQEFEATQCLRCGAIVLVPIIKNGNGGIRGGVRIEKVNIELVRENSPEVSPEMGDEEGG